MGAKAKTPTGNSTGFHVILLHGGFTICGCPFVKGPTETHVHCLFEEATRFISTKVKDSNTQHIDLEK